MNKYRVLERDGLFYVQVWCSHFVKFLFFFKRDEGLWMYATQTGDVAWDKSVAYVATTKKKANSVVKMFKEADKAISGIISEGDW